MYLIVRSLNGSSISVELPETSTVFELKEQVAEKTAHPIPYQRLIYRGKQLEDHQTLQQLEIANESTLFLVIKADEENNDVDVKRQEDVPTLTYVNEEFPSTDKEFETKDDGEDPVQIFVKLQTKASLAVDIKLSASVLALKTNLDGRTNVPPAYQRIMFRGKELNDGKSLRECGVEMEATLFMVERPRDEPPPPPPPVYAALSDEELKWARRRQFFVNLFVNYFLSPLSSLRLWMLRVLDPFIRPVYRFIADVFRWIHTRVLSPFWDFLSRSVKFCFRTLCSAGRFWRRMAEKATRGVESVVKPILRRLRALVTPIGNKLKDWIPSFFRGLGRALSSVCRKWNEFISKITSLCGSFFRTLWKGVKKIWKVIHSVARSVQRGILKPLSRTVGKVAKSCWRVISRVARAIGTFLRDCGRVLSRCSRAVWNGVKRYVFGPLRRGWTSLGNGCRSVSVACRGFWNNSVVPCLRRIKENVRALGNQVNRSIITPVCDFIKMLWRHLARFGRALGNSIRSVGRSIGKCLRSVGNTIGKVGRSIGKCLRSVGNTIGNVGRSIGNFFRSVGNKIGKFLRTVGRSIGNFFRSMGNTIGKCLRSVGNAIGNFLRSVGRTISSGVRKCARTIWDGVIYPVGSWLGKGVKWIGRNLFKGVKWTCENVVTPVLRPVGRLAKWCSAKLRPPMKWVLTALIQPFTTLFSGPTRVCYGRGGCAVKIPQGRMVYEGGGWVCLLPNDTPYQVCLRHIRVCNGDLNIDGTSMGTWRLNANQWYTIERPISSPNKFVFVRDESVQPGEMGANNHGRLVVTFKTQFPIQQRRGRANKKSRARATTSESAAWMESEAGEGDGLCRAETKEDRPGGVGKLQSGVTVLRGESDQSFEQIQQNEAFLGESSVVALRMAIDPLPWPSFTGKVRELKNSIIVYAAIAAVLVQAFVL